MAGEPLVLVVEDEPAQREVLAYYIQAEGYRVMTAEAGDIALGIVRKTPPDAIVLDSMLPHVSGVEVWRQLKADTETSRIPIIMLSARSEDVDKVCGLDLGADDYMPKPYSVADLLSRLRIQLRRVRLASVGERLDYEDMLVDLAEHRVYRNGELLSLGPTEFRLLTAFIERPGRVWSREQLLHRVWGRHSCVDTRTVDVHVGRLRKALKVGDHGDPIRTVRGVGYALG